jgi:hypothetical protein
MKGDIVSSIKELDKPKSLQVLSEIKDTKNLKSLKSISIDDISNIKLFTSSIDSGLTSSLVFGHFWNEAYGAIYTAIGKNEENSFKYVRDKDGFLFAGNFWNIPDVSAREYAKRVKRIQDNIADRGTKVVVLLFPTQYNEEWSDGYYGMAYQDYNEYGDEFIRWLRYYGIDYIDYKEYYLDENKSQEEIFYKTDHHWTVPASFEGFKLLVEHLNEKYDANLDEYYTDINNYKIEEYENAFMGSQGRDSGMTYSGLDDYTMILPKFDTRYYYTYRSSGSEESHLYGDITKTLIRRNYYYKEDYYDKDMNNVYMDGIYSYDLIENDLNKEGLSVLFLRDSYASSLATFFSSYCAKEEMIWSVRSDTREVEKMLNNNTYDYVFVAMAIDSVATGAIPYCATEVEEDVNE